MFESFVCDYLTSSMQVLIMDQQFGFMAGRSTELNILSFVDVVLGALEDGCQVHAIYTDFSKAFDRVNGCLVRKCENMGVGGSLLQWLG